MKFILSIDEKKFKEIKAEDYSNIWVVKDDELDKYVEAINKFQDDLIEQKGKPLKAGE